MKKITPPIALAVIASMTSTPVSANDIAQIPDFVGAGVRIQPVYDGANQNETLPVPLVSFEREYYFVRTTRGLFEAGAFITPTTHLRVGVAGNFELERDIDQLDSFAGLGLEDYSASASIGPFLEASCSLGPVPVNGLVRWRQNVLSERGAQADLRLTAGVLASERVRAATFAQVTWADAESMRFEYGLDAPTAVRAGLRTRTPSAGVRHYGLGLIGSFALTKRWSAIGIVEYRTVVGDVADSPFVLDSSNFQGTLGLAYRY